MDRINIEKIQNDNNRLKFHLMPPKGWMNDPNGLCQLNGTYHVFFQYSPDDPKGGGDRGWGHYVSSDLINWRYVGMPVRPDNILDKDGSYSGSAFLKDGKMYIYYTGNVKEEGEHDYTYSGRQANTIMLISRDGYNFTKKQCVLDAKDYPDYYTCHIRDPKVWCQDGKYYMIQGGRLNGRKKAEFIDCQKQRNSGGLSDADKEKILRDNADKGSVLIFESSDLIEWKICNEVTVGKDFGYMWECPDYFEVDGHKLLSLSPQGLPCLKYMYQNVYQSGHFDVKGEITGKAELENFREWDMGFDFYAPQTFEDESGRRIIIGWAGIGDIEYDNIPTIEEGWQHTLTVPRNINIQNGRVCQWPVKELEKLRDREVVISGDMTAELEGKAADIVVNNIADKEITMLIYCGDKESGIQLSYKDNVLSMEFVGKKGMAIGRGRDIRQFPVERLDDMRILIDNSIVEVYINGGEYVMTTRYYMAEKNLGIVFDSSSSDKSVFDNTKVWQMKNMEVQYE